VFTIQELTSFDNISNRGSNLDREIASDVLFYVTTPRYSIPYLEEIGIRTRENRPNTITRQIELTIDIIESIQRYNDATSEKSERRVAVDFQSLIFNDANKSEGDLDATLQYIQLKDLKLKRLF